MFGKGEHEISTGVTEGFDLLPISLIIRNLILFCLHLIQVHRAVVIRTVFIIHETWTK